MLDPSQNSGTRRPAQTRSLPHSTICRVPVLGKLWGIRLQACPTLGYKEIEMKKKDVGRIPIPHPGETIREDYLKPLGMSVNELALELRVPATRLAEIVHCRRGITADTALRLARYFSTTPKFWLNLQTSYELAVAEERNLSEIQRSVHPREAA
jgi:addiction module HigA family antidote